MKRAWHKATAVAMDSAMCGMMNVVQWRRGYSCSAQELDSYLEACGNTAREDFYQASSPSLPAADDNWLEWDTPLPSGFPENDRARVKLYPCAKGVTAPTVLILHALMSANDFGYRKIARWFNDRGWNAAFPHLPFHYSRTPRGHLNGELAITANLIRNGENLRQAVVELRQLMSYLRAHGCAEFGVIGTSYGGWTGALLSFVEPDLRFLGLIQPIVNVEAAIWDNPGSAALRRLLRKRGIKLGETVRHSHLSSPLHGTPLCAPERIIITAGLYDKVSPPADLRALHQAWKGSKLVEVRQGHFGYAAMPATLAEIEPLL